MTITERERQIDADDATQRELDARVAELNAKAAAKRAHNAEVARRADEVAKFENLLAKFEQRIANAATRIVELQALATQLQTSEAAGYPYNDNFVQTVSAFTSIRSLTDMVDFAPTVREDLQNRLTSAKIALAQAQK